MFDYDWFHGSAYTQHLEDAKWRCALKKFPKCTRENGLADSAFKTFFDAIEARTLVYLRDGFSYEVREIAEVESKSHFTFECEPVDEAYKAGAFVVSIPFDDIVRVEVFAVNGKEKPEDMQMITGFRIGVDVGSHQFSPGHPEVPLLHHAHIPLESPDRQTPEKHGDHVRHKGVQVAPVPVVEDAEPFRQLRLEGHMLPAFPEVPDLLPGHRGSNGTGPARDSASTGYRT